ncbi:unnamed protein product [Rotaria sordida]|uniref:Aldehyde dehydrogenase domain-containing protein n=1 Tax=Rotaria sordida TaxID=392033 RepID=A0A815MAI3_9BILA|nr:unnamed protein product [Rotaria sordida]
MNPFSIINPSTDEEICQVEEGTKSDLDKAIEAAEKGFQYDSPWRKFDPAARAQLIRKLADLLPRVVDYLATVMLALKLGSALVRGNVVILKPAEQTPLTALFCASAIKENSHTQLETILECIRSGKKVGTNLECGGDQVDDKSYFTRPTIFTNVKDGMKIAGEENISWF